MAVEAVGGERDAHGYDGGGRERRRL